MDKDKNSRQLDAWTGEFGDAYTGRNIVDPAKRVMAFKTMLAGLPLGKVLEVGCNRGHNLAAVANALGRPCELTGLEPNGLAFELAAKSFPQFNFVRGNSYALPFPDASFDLVFTAGVLIHIPPERLAEAMREIVRVASKYVLCIEYFAESEQEINYRGQDGLLWKRDFGGIYPKGFTSLKLLKNGYWAIEDGFDRTTWWLFEKA